MGIFGNLGRVLAVKAGGTVALAVDTAGDFLHAVDTQVTERIGADDFFAISSTEW